MSKSIGPITMKEFQAYLDRFGTTMSVEELGPAGVHSTLEMPGGLRIWSGTEWVPLFSMWMVLWITSHRGDWSVVPDEVEAGCKTSCDVDEYIASRIEALLPPEERGE